MPFLNEQKYSGAIGIYTWQLVEDAIELQSLCAARQIATTDVDAVKAVSRKKELLAEKLLVCEIFGDGKTLSRHENGEPFVENANCCVSITHTKSFVCLATNAAGRIGIDAEMMGARVLKVRDKFLSAAEKSRIAETDILSHLVMWTAKEAIFKIAGIGGLDFSEDIGVAPFALGAGTAEIELQGFCRSRGGKVSQYGVHTRITDDCVFSMALAR